MAQYGLESPLTQEFAGAGEQAEPCLGKGSVLRRPGNPLAAPPRAPGCSPPAAPAERCPAGKAFLCSQRQQKGGLELSDTSLKSLKVLTTGFVTIINFGFV